MLLLYMHLALKQGSLTMSSSLTTKAEDTFVMRGYTNSGIFLEEMIKGGKSGFPKIKGGGGVQRHVVSGQVIQLIM